MSGKWTDRGIECGHNPSHLVADHEGIAVCTKRKPREEIPVGKMCIEKLFPHGLHEEIFIGVGQTLLERLAPSANKSPEVGFIAQDLEIQQWHDELARANAIVLNAQKYAEEKLGALRACFREVIYEKNLAVPTLETLHDVRFACPTHPKSRFVWLRIVQRVGGTYPVEFKRSCLECSLPEHFKKALEENDTSSQEVPDCAYECPNCGIVLGKYDGVTPEGDPRWVAYQDTSILCRLCGTNIGTIYGIQR